MENKILNHIISVIWAMVFCINLIICIWISNPHPISWVMVGFSIGMLVMNLINSVVLNVQDELIKIQELLIKQQKKLIGEKKK